MLLYYIMAYFGFHGRYKKHCYEDCKDLKNKSFIEILNLDPSQIPSNILTNSCIFKKINKQDYITSIQLDAIQHLLMIKNNVRTKDNPNYEEVKDRIVRLFKNKYSEFCEEFNTFNTTNKKTMLGRDLFANQNEIPFASLKNNSQIESVMKEAYDTIVDENMERNDEKQQFKHLNRRLEKLNSSGGKKSSKRRKTKRRKSKKYFSLF